MLLAAVFACSRPLLPEPVLERAAPSFAWNGEAATIALVGHDFWPQVAVDTRDGAASVNPSYEARLVGPVGSAAQTVPLLGVGIVSDERLTATVPAGLPPGLWTLEVESPSGSVSSVPGGFRVTDQQAARISLEAERPVARAGEQVGLSLELLDVEGEVVELPFEIVIVATSPSGLVSLTAGTLADARPTPSGDGLRGLLQDGLAAVGVTSQTPGDVFLEVAAGDPYSPVAGDTLALAFDPGEDVEVALTLHDPGPYVAGRPFSVSAQLQDQYGNPIAQSLSGFHFQTRCSGWTGSVSLTEGAVDFAVTPTVACDGDLVQAAEDNYDGATERYDVVAGDAAQLEVLAAGRFDPLRAGDPVDVIVLPLDRYGNDASWTAGVTLSDSLGGLVDGSCRAVDDLRSCTATVTRAGPAVVLVATGDDGVVGASAPLAVRNDEVVASIDVVVAALATAGQPIGVRVAALDAWGNTVPAPETSDAFAVTDELGDADCRRIGTAADGSASFECTFTLARVDAVLTGSLDGLVDDAPLGVQNGALADVDIAAPAGVQAGDPFDVALVARDAWGNDWIVQDDPVVALTDTSGSLIPASVTFDAAGRVLASAVLTRAGTTRIAAWRGGGLLGQSGDVEVSPAPTDHLRLTTDGPWAWVDEPLTVVVESVDGFGNRTGVDAVGTLTSTATTAPPVAVPIVNGAGVAAFVWPDAAVPDTLSAAASLYAGSAEIVVGRRCATGPTAAVAFAAGPVGVACAGPTDGGTVVADLRGSSRGTLALSTYAAAAGGEPAVLDPSGTISLALPGVGETEIRGLALDTAGCADEAVGVAWSAPDDGSAAGVLALTSSVASLPVFGVATIEVVGATDCRGVPAAGDRVYVSSSGGALTGATPTGAGLALTLDATGGAATPLDTSAGGLQATDLHVVAAAPSGGARGELWLPLTGDAVRPVVVDAWPTGAGTDVVDTFSLAFSEPIGAGVAPGTFGVTGRGVVTASVVGEVVTFGVDVPVDGAQGSVLLTASTALRDLAGNRIAGDWSGAASPWQSAYGGGVPVLDPPTCGPVAPAGQRFRPDGDDGPDLEADRVVIDLASGAASPSWWVVEVTDEAGELVFCDWEVPVGALDQVAWDGRRFDGTVAPPGRYEVEVGAADGLGNRVVGCVLTVTVEGR